MMYTEVIFCFISRGELNFLFDPKSLSCCASPVEVFCLSLLFMYEVDVINFFGDFFLFLLI